MVKVRSLGKFNDSGGLGPKQGPRVQGPSVFKTIYGIYVYGVYVPYVLSLIYLYYYYNYKSLRSLMG